MFSASVEKHAHQHGQSAYPHEAVGFVIDGRYVPQVNSHPEPHSAFRVDGPYPKNLQAVIHSHPDGPEHVTRNDMLSQHSSAVPWAFYVTTGTASKPLIWFGDEAPTPPLLGRKFVHGVTDCYALVRDFYQLELNVKLPLYPREPDWWHGDEDMLTPERFTAAGFFEVPTDALRPGDLVLASILCAKPNHCAVYVGRGLVLHHLYNRLSRREPLGPWQKFCRYYLRHKEVQP